MQLYKATRDGQYMVWSATANVLQATGGGQQPKGSEAAADDKLLALAEAQLQRQLTFAPAEAKEETLRLMLHVLDLRRSPAAALQLLQVRAFSLCSYGENQIKQPASSGSLTTPQQPTPRKILTICG